MSQTATHNLEISNSIVTLLRAIADWDDVTLPTAAALARHLGYADESAVRYQLRRAEAQGLVAISKTGQGARAHRIPSLTVDGRAALEARGFRGNITDIIHLVKPEKRTLMHEYSFVHAGADCGSPDTTPQLSSLEESFGIRPDDDYSFRVVGDCMTPYFRGNDRLVMRPTSRPEDGSIVHVDLIGSEGECEPLLRQIARPSYGTVELTHFYPRKRTVQIEARKVLIRGRFVGMWRDESSILEQLRETFPQK